MSRWCHRSKVRRSESLFFRDSWINLYLLVSHSVKKRRALELLLESSDSSESEEELGPRGGKLVRAGGWGRKPRVVFSCYQKSGGPGAAVRCGDCHVRTLTTYVAGFGYRSEVNGCGALPLPPWPTHVTTCRLLFSPATCGGLGPTQSVRPRACVAGPPALRCTLM